MLFIMLISLYTSRITLNVLGVNDFGIYNVVGGTIVFLSFVSSAISGSTQRYLNYYMGKSQMDKVRQVFSGSLIIHAVLSVLFLIVAETIGLWFVYNYLNLPSERFTAALWVYHISVVSTSVGLMKMPYNATIIANEKMSFFAYSSILEAVFKLLIVFLLVKSPLDKLITYSFLQFLVVCIMLGIYIIYCTKHFTIAHYKKIVDIGLVKELMSFSGWNILGNFSNVAKIQGTNIVLNIYTSVAVNAAMAIANQVNNAVYNFVNNFQIAFTPQLVKTYASCDYKEHNELVTRSSKFSFLLLWIIALPLCLNTDYILKIWLKNVPVFSIGFVQLIMIYSMIEAINGPLWTSVQASGKIRTFMIVNSLIYLLNLPATILAFILGFNQYSVVVVMVIMDLIITFYRLNYLRKNQKFQLSFYSKEVFGRCGLIAIIAFIITYFISLSFTSLPRLLISGFSSIIINILLIYFIGFNVSEKRGFLTIIKSKIYK